ncbi:MAG: hypothetical protein EXS08_08710 [Planctomycetes bacterium]|nr:hypothetical protein [Planctomycetota bacterium]
MKLATALLAALLLSSTAFAQTRGAVAQTRGAVAQTRGAVAQTRGAVALRHLAPVAKAETAQLGSFARRKLLDQAQRGKNVGIEGAVLRRALLTGTRINVPKSNQQHTQPRRR